MAQSQAVKMLEAIEAMLEGRIDSGSFVKIISSLTELKSDFVLTLK